MPILRSRPLVALVTLLLVGSSARLLADDHGLPEEWLTDHDAALEEAKTTGKDVVAVFSASWCGPCRYMKQNIYPVDAVRDVIKEKFVAVYVDADEHQDLCDKYGVRGFPTYVFLDKTGNEVGRAIGGVRTPEQFLEMLKTKGASVGSELKYQLAKLGVVGGFGDWVKSVAFSPDGKRFAAGSYDVVKVYETEGRKEIATLKTRKGYATSLAFTPDGSQLLVGMYQVVELWDIEQAKRAKRFKGHKAYVTGLVLSPDGLRVATSSDDATVRVWTLADGSEFRVQETFEYLVQDVAWSPDGTLLATAGGDPERVTKPGPVKIWNAETGELVHELEPHLKAANSVAFSPDGKYLVSTSEDEKTNVYEVATGKPLGYFAGHQRATNDALFSPDGALVLSASGGRAKGKNTVQIWTRTEGELLALGEHREPVNDIALSPDATILASASSDGTVALWDIGKMFTEYAKDRALEAVGDEGEDTADDTVDEADDEPTPGIKDETEEGAFGDE